jgi:hypothetical protein
MDTAQQEIDMLKTKWLIENHVHMDDNMWKVLNLKQSILDIDLAESDLVMLSDFATLPYDKVNPVLLTVKMGNNPMQSDEVVANYVYVLESLQFD